MISQHVAIIMKDEIAISDRVMGLRFEIPSCGGIGVKRKSLVKTTWSCASVLKL